MLRHLLDFIWPAQCVACEAACDNQPPLCDECSADLSRLQGEAGCEWCAYPLNAPDDPCPRCEGRGLTPINRVGRLTVFQDPVRGMVHRMKYSKAWPLAEYLADRLVAHEPVKAILTETERFVPIPLHPIRQIQRGYNQAEVIARRLGMKCDVHVVEPLVRTRQTETQANLHAQHDRAANVQGAFDLLDHTDVSGKHITLVDDVMTTGSTLRVAARTLMKAKPASVSALVISVADPKGRAFTTI
jgi:ComF family protein